MNCGSWNSTGFSSANKKTAQIYSAALTWKPLSLRPWPSDLLRDFALLWITLIMHRDVAGGHWNPAEKKRCYRCLREVGTCLLWCRFSYLSSGLNVNAFSLCHVGCLYSSACCTFALWDLWGVKTEPQTIAWQISRKTHKGKAPNQNFTGWELTWCVCPARLTSPEDIAFWLSFVLTQV